MRKMLFGFSAGCVLAACGPAATPPGAAPPTTQPVPSQTVGTSEGGYVTTTSEVRVLAQEVAAPVDRVYAVLPAVYEEMGLEPGADASRRTVSAAMRFTRRLMGEPATRFLDCGSGQFGVAIASQYTIRMSVSTTVNPGTDGNSRLESAVEAHAYSDGANSVAAACRTEGRLEQMIVARVRQRLGT
ncbi:MAG TPA: hypothetical protein VM759_13270 [Longimicrobium sp.]|nr:hypothetical protein [Longimicrobium sp.]